MQTLHYKIYGHAPKTVVLIHGLFGSLENLNMVAKPLSEYFRVINIDVRNHGHSFHKNTMAYSELAQDIINVLDALNIESADVLGHSMGGKIAMQMALDFPDRVNKLIVADIAPVAYPAHHKTIIAGLQSIDFSIQQSRKAADKQLEKYVDNIGIRQFLLKNITETDGKAHFKCNLDNIAQGYQQIMQGIESQAQFDNPVLFIKGGNSDYLLAAHKNVIVSLFPHSKMKIIQNTGHWLHAEKPVAFNKIVYDFLNMS